MGYIYYITFVSLRMQEIRANKSRLGGNRNGIWFINGVLLGESELMEFSHNWMFFFFLERKLPYDLVCPSLKHSLPQWVSLSVIQSVAYPFLCKKYSKDLINSIIYTFSFTSFFLSYSFHFCSFSFFSLYLSLKIASLRGQEWPCTAWEWILTTYFMLLGTWT